MLGFVTKCLISLFLFLCTGYVAFKMYDASLRKKPITLSPFQFKVSLLFEKLASGSTAKNVTTAKRTISELIWRLWFSFRPEMHWSQPGEKKLTGGQNWQNKTMSTTQWSPAPMAPQPMPVQHVVRRQKHTQT